MRTDEPTTFASSWALPPTGITKEISFLGNACLTAWTAGIISLSPEINTALS